MYQNQNPTISDLSDYTAVMNETPKITFNKDKGHHLLIWNNSGLDKSYRFGPLVNVGIKNTPKNLFFMYHVIGYIDSNGKRKTYSYPSDVIDNHFILKNKYVYVSKEDRHTSIYTDYKVAQEYGKGETVYIVKRKDIDYKEEYSSILSKLGLKEDKSLGKAKVIQQYVKIIAKELKDRGKSYISLKADEEWIRDFKKKQKEASPAYQRRVANKMFVRSARLGFKGVDMPAISFEGRTGILVYGFREDKDMLEKIYDTVVDCHKEIREKVKKINNTYDRKKKELLQEDFDKAFMVIQIAKSNEDDIIGPKKTIYWKDFLNTIFFRKIETAYYIRTKLASLPMSNRKVRYALIKGFKEEYENLTKMIEKYSTSSPDNLSVPLHYRSEKYIQSMVNEYNRFTEKYLYDIPLISSLVSDVLENTLALESLIEYFKDRKIRLNNKYYMKPSSYLTN
jgi:hypothetical protein